MAIGGPGSSVFIDPGAEHMFGEAKIELRDIDQVLSSLRSIGSISSRSTSRVASTS